MTRLAVIAIPLFLLSTFFLPEKMPAPEETEPAKIPPIVFVSRRALSSNAPGAVAGMGPSNRTVKVGGSLLVGEPDGSIRVLLDSSSGIHDASDPKVRWDGARVVFAGVEHPDSSWRIYEIGADGGGLRKVTRSDRSVDLSQFGSAGSLFREYDDFDPCYLPDGRIVFASTRFPAVAEHGDVLASNLFVVNPDGSGLHRITTERNGAEQPAVDPTSGRIVYARWWLNIDRPSNVARDGLARDPLRTVVDDAANLWHAITVTPDGDDIKLYAGDPRTREGSQSYRPVILADGRLLCVYSPNLSLFPSPGGVGVRWFHRGADTPHHVLGAKQSRAMEVRPPYATDPVVMPDGRILLSFSGDGTDYGLYTCNLDGSSLNKVLDFKKTSELNADVIVPRSVPPIIKARFEPPRQGLPPTEDPSSFYANDSFRFDCLNIFANDEVDVPIPNAPPITRNASIRFFLNFQRQNRSGRDPSILIRSAPVYSRGGVHEHDLPADVPMFEQIVDSLGRVLVGRDGKAAHVTGLNFNRAGTGTKCVGCHSGHTLIAVPKNYSEAEWTNVSPSARVSASSVFALSDTVWFRPDYVVDRKVMSSKFFENWVAGTARNEYIDLAWDIPIEVKTLVLYSILQDSLRRVAISVKDCEVVFFLGDEEVCRVRRTGAIRVGGTRVLLEPGKIVDRLRIKVKDTAGHVAGRRRAGLAEVETIARIAN